MLSSAIEPLETLDPARIDRFPDGAMHEVFTRLRRDAPVHYCPASDFGAYWSVTSYRDIVEIEALPQLYSSEITRGGVSIVDADFATPNADAAEIEANRLEMFIAMDPPRHAEKRRVVAPAFTPSEIARLSVSLRERTAEKLDSLPRGETFDWTSEVSISLTTDMLAILFDFPWEERDKLHIWSDAITNLEMLRNDRDRRNAMMFEMAMRFFQLWQERAEAPPAPDLLSMMIHSNALGKMEQKEFIGNMALLIVGGNDTTRNSMSALIDAILRWPGEWEKVIADPGLAANCANETIRWHSPVLHMRRTVTEDHEFRGHNFRAGDKVAMWYVSANRDESVFQEGDLFRVDRDNARRHLSFGYGVHRCVGARLAELQIATLIEEMAKRKMRFEPAGPIVREAHNFVHQVLSTPVRIVSG